MQQGKHYKALNYIQNKLNHQLFLNPKIQLFKIRNLTFSPHLVQCDIVCSNAEICFISTVHKNVGQNCPLPSSVVYDRNYLFFCIPNQNINSNKIFLTKNKKFQKSWCFDFFFGLDRYTYMQFQKFSRTLTSSSPTILLFPIYRTHVF